jgi:hypothetical protein
MKKICIHILILLSISSISWAVEIESSQLDSIASILSSDIASSFPSFSGHVLSTKGDNGVYISIGEKDGLTKSERFEVFSQGTGIIKDSKGKFIGYESDQLALIEVEWVKDDYAFAKVVRRFIDTPIEQMDLLHYIQPQRSIYIGEFRNPPGDELAQKVATHLDRVKFIEVFSSDFQADCYVDGDVIQRSHGLDVRLNLRWADSTLINKIEKRFVVSRDESPEIITGIGYTAYPLSEKALDVTTFDGSDILILGEKHLFKGTLDSDGPEITSKDKLSDKGNLAIREPVGRIVFFNLDNFGDRELLLGRVPEELSRYYNKDGSQYKLAGPLPGMPLSSTDNGILLVGKLNPGGTTFEPSETNLINVSSIGSGGQKSVWNISGAFIDAELVDFNNDGEFEIAVLYPDGIMQVFNPDEVELNPEMRVDGIGLGLCADSNGSILTSSSSSVNDSIFRFVKQDSALVKISESSIIPFHIYRIRILDDKITALALDDNDRSYLVIFDDF